MLRRVQPGREYLCDPSAGSGCAYVTASWVKLDWRHLVMSVILDGS